MKLDDLLYKNAPAIEIEEITDNSAKSNASSLFFCICGARSDGHDYAMHAYQNGCRAFVCERKINLPSDAYVYYTDNTRRALALTASKFYGEPSRQMTVVGITGTKGKTTVATLLHRLLCEMDIPCGYIGTNGVAYRDISHPLKNTTPDPITLQNTLRQMLDAGVKAVIMEVSSQAIYQSRIDGMTFDACVFTNLYTDHIGPSEHPSFDHYKHCKHCLFSDYGCKTMIANLDDRYASEMQENTSATSIIGYSTRSNQADYYAYNVLPTIGKRGYGVSFSLKDKETDIPFTLSMLGKFNVQNALAVIATAREIFHVSLRDIAKHLSTLSVEGRTETLSLSNGACVVIDYAHNGSSLSALLSALREYKPNRLICLFGSVGERSELRRKALGNAAATLADLAILTSDNPGREDPMAIISEIAASFEGTRTPYLTIPDRAKAIQEAVRMLLPNDILVLAGKGHENYQLIGSEKQPFSDREELLSALKNARLTIL